MTNLLDQFVQTRHFSRHLVGPLAVEDFVVQSMPDVSPMRWHLAHTTWFFEQFVLEKWDPDYHPVCPDFRYLFNSYYESVGEQFPRARRGLLTRPTVAEVFDYREAVEARVTAQLEQAGPSADEIAKVVELGIHHEQQHQELMLTDLKHNFSCNPLFPIYRAGASATGSDRPAPMRFQSYAEGVVEIGHNGTSFSFDNERPRHKVYLQPFELSQRLITNGEYQEFIADDGYKRAEFWLSLGWATVREEVWQAPLYWIQRDSTWHEFTLAGLQVLDPHAPVCHLSYFEADAFARWSGARLPTEAEWEHAVADLPREGSFVESGHYHPSGPATSQLGLQQMYGELWQWTASPYTAYPGYRAPAGALGEYNGKFMCNQYVLRGGSCATPREHIRSTYRNFFPPEARWQFTGLRLARDAGPD